MNKQGVTDNPCFPLFRFALERGDFFMYIRSAFKFFLTQEYDAQDRDLGLILYAVPPGRWIPMAFWAAFAARESSTTLSCSETSVGAICAWHQRRRAASHSRCSGDSENCVIISSQRAAARRHSPRPSSLSAISSLTFIVNVTGDGSRLRILVPHTTKSLRDRGIAQAGR
jgi:hypothetical protein